MIGIDTNIVIRLLLRDDEAMYTTAERLIRRVEPFDPLAVNPVVVTECVWVLERQLKLDRKVSRPALSSFLESSEIRVLEQTPLVAWRDVLSHDHRDFSDIIIARINLEAGCDFTYTLDKRAARDVPGMKLLT